MWPLLVLLSKFNAPSFFLYITVLKFVSLCVCGYDLYQGFWRPSAHETTNTSYRRVDILDCFACYAC